MEHDSIEARAQRWAASRHTGVSSKAIMATMTGNPPADGYCYPHDGADLERCVILLTGIPEWRARLAEMKAVGPEWAALVEHWDELERLFLKEGYGPVTKRMQEILRPIEAKRPALVRIKGGAIYFGGMAKGGTQK